MSLGLHRARTAQWQVDWPHRSTVNPRTAADTKLPTLKKNSPTPESASLDRTVQRTYNQSKSRQDVARLLFEHQPCQPQFTNATLSAAKSNSRTALNTFILAIVIDDSSHRIRERHIP